MSKVDKCFTDSCLYFQAFLGQSRSGELFFGNKDQISRSKHYIYTLILSYVPNFQPLHQSLAMGRLSLV